MEENERIDTKQVEEEEEENGSVILCWCSKLSTSSRRMIH